MGRGWSFEAKILAATVGVCLPLGVDNVDAHSPAVAWEFRTDWLLVASVYLGAIALAGLRWQILLHVLRFPMPARNAILVMPISTSCHAFLPATIRGNCVRVANLFGHCRDHSGVTRPRRSAAAAAVSANRVNGPLGLLIFTSGTIAIEALIGAEHAFALSIGVAALIVLLTMSAGMSIAFSASSFSSGWVVSETVSPPHDAMGRQSLRMCAIFPRVP